MKIVKNGQRLAAAVCLAAVVSGGALPALAVNPAGYTSLTQAEEVNSITPEQVEELINEIGVVTLESATAIENAEKSYEELADNWKPMVSNYSVLQNAQKELQDLQVDDLTQKLCAGLYKEHDDVENYDCYLWAGWPKTDQINFVMPYFCVSPQNGIEPIRMMYGSYRSNWLFLNEVVYSVNGEIYRKTLDTSKRFSKTVVEFKNVYTWEKIDEIADQKEIEMLRKATVAEDPVIRLKGDGGKVDLHITGLYENYNKSLTAFLNAYDSLMAASPEVQARALANVPSHKSNSKFFRF
jgi:hypothetical protein